MFNRNKPMVLFTCGREPIYPRNAVIRSGLSRHFDLLEVIDQTPWLPLRYLRLAIKLLIALRKRYDIVFVGFLGQPLMPLVFRCTRKPILFDAFLSVYDTLCFDRKRFAPHSLIGRTAFWLDQSSCAQADNVCLDTQTHSQYFYKTFGVPLGKLHSIFVGCDENIFYPRPNDNTNPLVLFYGSFLPLHGIDVILRAAELLKDKSELRIRIIGSGMESNQTMNLAAQLNLQNVDFISPVPMSVLPVHIKQATICLGGHFGATEKAGRVIAGKTFQCIAMAKPTIVGENPANHELLTHGKDAWFCKMNDAQALAEAITYLMENKSLAQELGENARRTYLEKASNKVLDAQLESIVSKML